MPPKTRTVFPPHYNHHITPCPPSLAQHTLSNYLNLTILNPHPHPNSTLSNLGIAFSANTGPSGGIVLHQLKRIEAGLRGEVLEPETREELEARFGADELPLEPDEYGWSTTKRRKQRAIRGMNEEDIEAWSSDVGANVPREIESFANTPLHTPMNENMDGKGWQDLKEWEENQEVWEGEVGEREVVGGLKGGEEVGAIPEVVVEGQGRTALEKEERKRRKKEKKEQIRREKARIGKGG